MNRIRPSRLTRRDLLKRIGGLALLAAGGTYPFLEAKWCTVTRQRVALPGLPAAFEGLTIALLSDIHHGPFVPLAYIQHVVAMANALNADVVALAGDYVHQGHAFVHPCLEVLGGLRAKLGRFAVLGNHDHWEGAARSRRAIRAAGFHEVYNDGVWLRRGNARIRFAGVGDVMEDRQDLDACVADARSEDCVVLLCHEPDFADTIVDPRIRLVLSGHTHGGQIVFPFVGPPVLPPYGRKFPSGLLRAASAQVFVTRGVGTITPPVRLFCRPEVALLTLARDGGPVEGC